MPQALNFLLDLLNLHLLKQNRASRATEDKEDSMLQTSIAAKQDNSLSGENEGIQLRCQKVSGQNHY